MHQDHRHAFAGGHFPELRIGAQCPAVVDPVGAGAQGSLRHLGFIGVDGDQHVHIRAAQGFDHRQDARKLLLLADGSGAGAGALAADIQDIRAAIHELVGLFDGALGQLAAVHQAVAGEAIGGDVQDAHDVRSGTEG